MADCKEEENKEENKDEKPEAKSPNVVEIDSSEASSDSLNEEREKVNLDKESENSSMSNSISNDASNNPSPDSKSNDAKMKSSVLTASKFGSNFGVNPAESSSSTVKNNSFDFTLLRPSALSSITNSSGSTAKNILRPPKFKNPFAKSTDNDEDDNEKLEEDKVAGSNENSESKEESTEKPTFLALEKSPSNVSDTCTNSVLAAAPSTPGFVFGQNLKERVAVARDADSSDSSDKEEETKAIASENGASSLMFSNAAAVCKTASKNDKPDKTLTEAAQELEEANRANKRKYDEVALYTGEEDETNVLQINCKLFAYDKATSGYQERGRGSLRLNDRDDESRLVGRTAGTQRLVLNTKVWPGMTAERAGPKSLRLTAMDVQGEVRIFVVQAAQKEVEELHDMLISRLKRAQERQPKKVASEP